MAVKIGRYRGETGKKEREKERMRRRLVVQIAVAWGGLKGLKLQTGMELGPQPKVRNVQAVPD